MSGTSTVLLALSMVVATGAPGAESRRIAPISIAGGTVKVKDELKVEFDIVAQR